MPPPRPRRPPFQLRRRQLVTLIAVLLAGSALTALAGWQPWAPTAQVVAGAADTLGDAPAVTLDYTYTDESGWQTTGTFTVTSEGYATGTITDTGGGTAAYVATPDGSAVYGDDSWWLRRSPERMDQVRDRWVRPDDTAAFPFEVTSALNPSAIATLVGAVGAGGELVDEGSTVDGVPVVTVTSGDWTLLLTQEVPRRVVWLGGPVESGELLPALDTGAGVHIVPVGLSDQDVSVHEVETGSGGGQIAMAPEPEDSGNADKAKTDASGTMSGKGTTPPGMAAPSSTPSASGEEPPKEANLPPNQPRFTAEPSGSDCSTPLCTWIVTVTNVGTEAASGIAYSAAIPVNPPQPCPFPVLQPGESYTCTFSGENGAPPGGKITVTLVCSVYSADLHGKDPKKYEKLVGRGVDPAPFLEKIAKSVQPALIDAMVEMGDTGLDAEHVQQAMENADRDGLMGMIKDFHAAGDRFEDFGTVGKFLSLEDPQQYRGHLHEMRRAHDLLMDPSEPTVKLGGHAPGKDRQGKDVKAGCDVLVISAAGMTCYQVKHVNNNGLIRAMNKAIGQLNGTEGLDKRTKTLETTPTGATSVAEITLGSGSDHRNYTRDDLVNFLKTKKNTVNICKDPSLTVDHLVIVNNTGRHEIAPSEFCG